MAFVDGVAPGIQFMEIEEQGVSALTASNAVAIVGVAPKGPFEVTKLTSIAQAIKLFGNPKGVNTALYAVLNCLKYNKEVYFKRVVHEETAKQAEATADWFIAKTQDKTDLYNDYTISMKLDAETSKMVYTLKDAKGKIVETFSNLVIDKDAKMYFATVINKFSEYITIEEKEAEATADVTDLAFANGNAGDENATDAEFVEAMVALNDPEGLDFATLVVPYNTSKAVYDKAMEICDYRKDIVYIPSAPLTLKTVAEYQSYFSQAGSYNETGYRFDSTYVALFAPNGIIIDNETGEDVVVDIAPFVAAAWTNSDNLPDSALWFAPAGVKRGKVYGIDKLVVNFSKEERDALYARKYNINCLANVRGHGICIMGAHTSKEYTVVDTNTALQFINVRRLCNHIRKMVNIDSMYNLFDANDRYTWNDWKMRIDPKMRAIKEGRGVYDYILKMDEDTVTQQDIDEGRMPGIIKIAPEKPAEYIDINFIIAKDGTVAFEEEE